MKMVKIGLKWQCIHTIFCCDIVTPTKQVLKVPVLTLLPVLPSHRPVLKIDETGQKGMAKSYIQNSS